MAADTLLTRRVQVTIDPTQILDLEDIRFAVQREVDAALERIAIDLHAKHGVRFLATDESSGATIVAVE